MKREGGWTVFRRLAFDSLSLVFRRSRNLPLGQRQDQQLLMSRHPVL